MDGSSWLTRLRERRELQIALAAPAALSAIASLQGIGQIAHAIVNLWAPIFGWIRFPFVTWLHLDDATARILATMLLLLPFGISGVWNYAQRRQRSVSFVQGLLAIAAYAVVLSAVLLPTFAAFSSQAMSAYPMIVYAMIFSVLLLGWYAAIFTTAWLVWKLVRRRDQISLLVLPIIVGAIFALLPFAPTQNGQHLSIPAALFVATMLFCITSLPLMNPRRLIDVALIIVGLLALSLTYDGISALLSHDTPTARA